MSAQRLKYNQYPTLISFLKDIVFDGDRINVATSIHLQKDVNSYLNNLPESAKIYINKNKTGNVVGSSFKIGTLATKANLVIQDSNISEAERQEDNSRKSARTS